MELTREQVNVGIAAGLALTNPEDDKLYCPMKHCAGALVLRQLLMSLASGQIGLQSTMQQEAPQPPQPPKEGAAVKPPVKPPTAKKKVAKKKIAKKK